MSLTLGISRGQPRVFLETCGQVRYVVFTAPIMLTAWSCVLQYRLNGDSTFAHSSSQLVGSPLSHALAALAQQAELTSASQPWYAYTKHGVQGHRLVSHASSTLLGMLPRPTAW